MMNILACSSAQATASSFPSVVVLYRTSAPFVNREPTNTNFHPSLQQTGADVIGHLQYCWRRRYPIPSLHQSGCRQVGLLRSNVWISSMLHSYKFYFWLLEYSGQRLIPCEICVFLDQISEGLHCGGVWLFPCYLSDQAKPCPGFDQISEGLHCGWVWLFPCYLSDQAKSYPGLIQSGRFLEFSYSWYCLIVWSDGLKPVWVIFNPANCTESWQNSKFDLVERDAVLFTYFQVVPCMGVAVFHVVVP